MALEIIYLWVARMIMSTLHFRDVIPFDTVLLHGTVRDELGRKMSKSLGNSPDPIDIIDKVGADALRFSMVFGTPKGADVIYSDAILETGRNFANKIWNAYRFIMMNVGEGEKLPDRKDLKLELADRWIYSRLNETAREAANHYQNLRLNDAGQCVPIHLGRILFLYIELPKTASIPRTPPRAAPRLYPSRRDAVCHAPAASHHALHHEEIRQSVKTVFPQPEEALIEAAFPVCDDTLVDPAIADDMAFMQEAILPCATGKQINLS